MEKLRENLKVIGPEDTTVLLGDLSWAMSLDDAAEDFSFMNAIPGRKIILKGNHDYWWTTLRAFDRFCAEHGFADFHVLNNSCFFYGDIALCGTRGWFYDAQKEGSHDEKIFRRELGRLERSLQLAGDAEKYCFLHYPPLYQGYECPEILRLLQRYGVKRCFYGHLHAPATSGRWRGCTTARIFHWWRGIGWTSSLKKFANKRKNSGNSHSYLVSYYIALVLL